MGLTTIKLLVNMKKLLFIISVVALTGCAKEIEPPEPRIPVSGNEIEFGARTKPFEIPDTKTIYGVPDGSTYDNYQELTISWIDGDQVRVFCPQAESPFYSADYDVLYDDAGGSHYLQKLHENGVHWGDVATEQHEFYSFYPLGKIKSGLTKADVDANGLKVTANIPVAQEHGELVTGLQDPNWRIIKPDMSYCMMAGRGTWVPGTDRVVSMNYVPLVTVLDVVVSSSGGAVSDKIVSISVRSKNEAIVGDFTYDFETGEFTIPEGNEDNRIATVDCMVNGNPVEISGEQKLNVKFFLLPRNISADELSVSVLLQGGIVLTKSLVPDGSTGPELLQGQIVTVKTPKITTGEPSNWMSLIDDEVLFASQLSLPGSKHSYTYGTYSSESRSYDANSGIMQTYQTLDIGAQFDAGIRAFDIKVNTYNNSSGAIYVGESDLPGQTLHGLLDLLKQKLTDSPEECAILAINYVDPGDERQTAQQWLDKLCKSIDKWSENNPAPAGSHDPDYFREVTASTVMGNMRGGIGVMIHYPEANPSYTSSNVNVIPSYSSSVQNTEIVSYSVSSTLGSGTVNIQNLQQINNPDLGTLPYFITEDAAKERDSTNLLGTKMSLIKQLFRDARNNNQSGNTGNLYVNDLGGFCVVNNDQSTGYITAIEYHCKLGFFTYNWDENRRWTITDYADFPTGNGYDYFTVDGSEPVEPSWSTRNDTWLNVDTGGSVMGQGGNNALLAEEINPKVANTIYNLVNEGRTPLGVVYINFAGVDEVTFNSRTYSVSGNQLPSMIVSNNFKFALKTSADATHM